MKKLVRIFLATAAAIYTIAHFFGGISYSNDWRVLLMAAAVLTGANIIIKPIAKIITLPINLLTLGMFSSVISALMLYGVTYVVPKFSISPFDFAGFVYKGVTMPAMSFGPIWAYVVIAASISIVVSVLDWITD
jgi:putative membrane protein